ncbi:MAG TPA: FkbM family methyltransferase [Lacipirellulaceae bacterium]|nr:FkbM family methyltransferase [Lacipirellulaceae bacterium]
MIGKLARLREALGYPGGRAAMTKARPRSLTSWVICNRLKSLGGTYHTIVDAGANAGQFARAAHLCFPEARILSFKPLPDVADRLAANLSDVAGHKIFRTALGAADGVTRFHRNSYDQSSSVLPMLHNQGGMLADKREVDELEVPLARLDSALAGEQLQGDCLLKLDLQGNELAALRGAEKCLGAFRSIILETVFEAEYVDEPLFEEIWEYLHAREFTFERPLNFSHGKSGRIVQMDALFTRRRAKATIPS